ncbi:Signal transduction histidine kinase [Catalinimonas alkaloidigena]|uniref:histidine kinase n=1 Tax=Catalinimonas alkaloidigena TaxID=1075417 RepID=A0A1G9DCS4_9BACT|nr:GAF domain-containing sensor histidine kinase [Catalinimonas alkaloidigena]SDK61640.1 Signal transduction histidine kinase [Catalinimonas alkaloidigena]
MSFSSLPEHEAARIDALKRYHILDTQAEQDFDDLVQLASQICGTPISLISLVDERRQWFKANKGLSASETPRELAFCAHALHQTEPLVVTDATHDERFAQNPLVTDDPSIRFYAGVPLTTPDGYNLGTLCVIDRVPRHLTDQQLFALRTLARQVIQQFELRLQNKQMDQQLSEISEQRLELQRLTRIQQQMLSIISHDVRSPLLSLSGILSILEKRDLRSDQLQPLFREARRGVSSARDLLENLLQWASQQFSGEQLRVKPIELSPVVEQCIAQFTQESHLKSLALLNEVAPRVEVFADLDILQAILRNLLHNAVKFTAQGSIRVRLESQPDRDVISVQDTGVGMSTHQLDRLLKWGYYQKTADTQGNKGSGLGLLINKEFVSKLGGKIWVESALGQGSTFFVSLPRPAAA